MINEELLAEGPCRDLRAEVVRRRATAIAEADLRGVPRRPLHVLIEEFDQLDRRRLRGD